MSHFLAAGAKAAPGIWSQASQLGLALLLSAVIGMECEMRQKSAGLRTHTLVGVGAALFMLISKYGFTDVLEPGRVVLDPSRVAAQIVTGIGFLGAGLIFVRRDSVRGLTTAAGIWLTAAVGAAAGARLPILAALATGAYLLVARVLPLVTRRLPSSATAISVIRVRYPGGRDILRQVLGVATGHGFAVDQMSTEEMDSGLLQAGQASGHGTVEVVLHVYGKGSVNDLATQLSELPGVHAVMADDINTRAE